MVKLIEKNSTLELEQFNIVIIGHVDHGKSTVIGRLLADTGSLPQGKLDQVKRMCAKNARPFEYAFLLDALKDEQAQGITIDTARCFFKTQKRHYIIIDAPGHIEFLKNMVTGAARAEAALLVIDVNEGIRENSRRHGYIASFLGIKQIAVLINKMDLVQYDEEIFNKIKAEFTIFLEEINVKPLTYIPVSAFQGDNIVDHSDKMPWYSGKTVIELIDGLEKEENETIKPFRMPVQDIYKFTENNDNRRIIAGTIISGKIKTGDEVVFLPSKKHSVIQSIESFNEPVKSEIQAGYAAGFTLQTQLYLKPGEMMYKKNETPPVSTTSVKANIFWLGKNPLILNKKYQLKTGTTKVSVYLRQIMSVLDASKLAVETNKKQIERHDVAECILETNKPIAVDLISENEKCGRFVIIDGYEITGGGIITGIVKEDFSLEPIMERLQGFSGYPVSINITAKPCLVVGGGQAAFRKVMGLLKAEADITVISPEIQSNLKFLKNQKRIKWIKRRFVKSDIINQFLLIAATHNKNLNRKITRLAHENKILCNNVSSRSGSSFHNMGVIYLKDMTIGISCKSNNPAKVKQIKEKLRNLND